MILTLHQLVTYFLEFPAHLHSIGRIVRHITNTVCITLEQIDTGKKGLRGKVLVVCIAQPVTLTDKTFAYSKQDNNFIATWTCG